MRVLFINPVGTLVAGGPRSIEDVGGVVRRFRRTARDANSRAVAAEHIEAMPRTAVRTLYSAVDEVEFQPGSERADLAALSGLTNDGSPCVRFGMYDELAPRVMARPPTKAAP